MIDHKFGMMPAPPAPGQRYDAYEPQKYGCIAVQDDDLLLLAGHLRGIRCYWYTLDRPEWGLAWYGITLIPPTSLDALIESVWKNERLSDLFALLAQAQREGRWVIHFGI